MYVDPRNPADVRFSGAGSASGLVGWSWSAPGVMLGVLAVVVGVALTSAAR